MIYQDFYNNVLTVIKLKLTKKKETFVNYMVNSHYQPRNLLNVQIFAAKIIVIFAGSNLNLCLAEVLILSWDVF